MRRVLTASILALLAFGLLLAGTGAASAQDEANGLDGTFGVAPSRPGDRGLYSLYMVRIDDSEEGGWAYDAGARLEVERLGDRVMPVDGTPVVAQSFATTWAIEPVNWGAWAMDWQMGEFTAAMEDFGDNMDRDWDDMSEEDWEDYEEGMEEFGEAMEDWADSFEGMFAGWDGIQGEPWHVAHVGPDHRVVATTREGTDSDLPGNRLAASLGLEPQANVLTTFGPSSAPCGFHSDLQDAIVPLGQKIHVQGNCPPVGGYFGTLPNNITTDRYEAVGHDLVQGRPAIVYAHESGADSLRLWYAQDVPYPVRMVVPVQLYDGYEVLLLYEMTQFQQGSLQPAQAPAAPAMLPRLVSGPDSTGVETPFSLAAALTAASVDKENTAVRDFLAAHVDAAIDEAQFLRLVDRAGNQYQERWTFTLVSGGDALHVTATRGAPYQGPTNEWPQNVPPLPPGTVPAEAQAVVDDGVLVESASDSSLGRVLPAQMPRDLPSVADLLAQWRADGAGGSIPAWSFSLRPDGSSWIAVGQAEAEVHWEEAQEGSELVFDSVAYSFYGVGPDGSFRFVEESPTREGYDVPEEQDPDELDDSYDPESDDDWSSPSEFALAAVSYWKLPAPKTTATVTAAAGLVGLLAYVLLPAKFGALGLFSRIGSDQVLEHPLRAQITDLVAAEPGIHFQELVRRLDAGRGTMEHHLRKLVAANVLTMQVSQGFTCFFPKGKVDRHLMAAAPVLKSEGARQVLQAIQAQPGRAAQDVAAAIGLTPSTVNYHLKRLVASGLVSHERSGRFILLTPTPLGTQALGAWGRT